MPAFRGLQSMHQSRLSRLDDEKVGISLGSPLPATSSSSSLFPSASSLPALDRKTMSSAPKLSRKEVHRLVQEAMAIGVQPHSSVQFPTHRLDHDVDKGSFMSSQVATSLATKSRLMEKSLDLHMAECPDSMEAARNNDDRVICTEVADRGAQWKYSLKTKPGKEGGSMFSIIDTRCDHNPFDDLMVFVRSWLVPEGYPDSVSPSYTPYMRWRALKYLFGGAMNVFTTRSLLHAVGVSRHGSATTAMAVNWVIKDGAGRVGKLLFARQGKKFDYDMKQLRFTGDLLMELGAAVELATVAAPHLFLPLACAANVAKNVAAVASTSTRAPIYKSFARGENIGDVTARGECISNIADLVGTGLGIFLSKKNPSLMVTFAVLSCGYLCCSYNEVKSVCLPTLNCARFKVAVQTFLETGRVPSVSQGNREEIIFTPPWVKAKPFALGARINEAFQSPHTFFKLLPLFQRENYLVTYHPSKRRAFAVLKNEARSDDVLRASFHAQVIEDLLQRPLSLRHGIRTTGVGSSVIPNSSETSIEAAIRESCKLVPRLFESFKNQALSQGWVMGESLLNPGSARLCV